MLCVCAFQVAPGAKEVFGAAYVRKGGVERLDRVDDAQPAATDRAALHQVGQGQNQQDALQELGWHGQPVVLGRTRKRDAPARAW